MMISNLFGSWGIWSIWCFPRVQQVEVVRLFRIESQFERYLIEECQGLGNVIHRGMVSNDRSFCIVVSHNIFVGSESVEPF